MIWELEGVQLTVELGIEDCISASGSPDEGDYTRKYVAKVWHKSQDVTEFVLAMGDEDEILGSV